MDSSARDFPSTLYELSKMGKKSVILTKEGLRKFKAALDALSKSLSSQSWTGMAEALNLDRDTFATILERTSGVLEKTLDNLSNQLYSRGITLSLEEDIDYEVLESLKACQQGIDKVKSKVGLTGAKLESNLVGKTNLACNVIKRFLSGKPIPKYYFKRICISLNLDWKEIAGISKEQSEWSAGNERSSLNTNEGVKPVQTVRRRVTVIDETRQTIITVIVLEGDINSVPNFKIIETVLREHSGRTITIIDIQEGSIKLIIEGSPEDIKRLVSCIESRELREIQGFPVKGIIPSESLGDEEIAEANANAKWDLVEAIFSQPLRGLDLENTDLSDVNLSNTNLSGTDLSGTDLSGTDLSGTDLSGADLSQTDLRRADLRSADLSNAGLNDADLRRTNLFRATLHRADLSGANLIDANLGGANLIDANLGGANLRGANLSGARLKRANLRGANLRGTNLIGAILSDADLKHADIDDATKLADKWRLVWKIINQGTENQDLRGTDLINANLSGANLRGANLNGAMLIDADLSGANLRGANLRGANLRGANLRGAEVDDTTEVDDITEVGKWGLVWRMGGS
ncbi:pentapeptide repeat-containing protein [Scytonema millei]|uniref:Pentapeptide repeat-containing protein n=1 Tax=Scytonema millei VB511283 TaxID=1245923 RepID=A0A9X5E673_9CYAN|nr:pentapeptide repeat-containing protein [Scytonema millei]NHC35962.1 pentapeptide repeat-containing protein [Scytonema millei VB511283]